MCHKKNVFKSRAQPPVMSINSTLSTVLFDIFLAVAFPTLCVISWPYTVPFVVFIALILIHIGIAVVRYGYLREIVWPIWADVVAIYMGVALLLSAIVPRQSLTISIVWSTVGLFIMYGHVRKLLFPERPYYFDG